VIATVTKFLNPPEKCQAVSQIIMTFMMLGQKGSAGLLGGVTFEVILLIIRQTVSS
jgi:hypothetical protein